MRLPFGAGGRSNGRRPWIRVEVKPPLEVVTVNAERVRRLLTLGVVVWIVACGSSGDVDTTDAADMGQEVAAPVTPVITHVTQVVPSDGLPAEVLVQPSANNLDLADHEGRLFLAFRTAPNHFANDQTRIYVVSSTDEQTWELEAEFFMGTDLREPRLLAWNGRLFLYVAVLGTNPMAFEPQGVRVSERTGPGQWTELEPLWEEAFILWRARVLDGRPHILGYRGGGDIYSGDVAHIDVHLLTTDDGVTLAPLVSGQPTVLQGGVSETDVAYAPDGALIAVSRVEAADGQGFGSRICRAEPGALADWTCVSDPKKYDSQSHVFHVTRTICKTYCNRCQADKDRLNVLHHDEGASRTW